MSRTARLDIAGCIYHVITRGNERRAIFKDVADREDFLRRFSEALVETKSTCYGWVLMPNHFHLLIGTLLGKMIAMSFKNDYNDVVNSKEKVIDFNEAIAYWVEGAAYDLDAAQGSFEKRKYPYQKM